MSRRNASAPPLSRRSKSAIHCSLDERAFTNLTTNATQFSGIDLENDIRRILTLGGFPRESLPSVLHESVHHWCFHTPVGSALTFLNTRSRMQAVEWAVTGDDGLAINAFDDYLRYEAATRVLRPLAEGLALFFEYDVMPYPSTPIASRPMLWAWGFFSNGTGEDAEDAWGMSLLKVLGEVRLSEPMIRRKTNLLMQPLVCSAGGYLPGYLTVKNLWRKCRDKHHAFHDGDLFATLVRRFFYGDYGLVNVILDKSRSGPDWLAGLVDAIGYRINDLLKADLQEAERVLIETVLNPSEPVAYDGRMMRTDYPPMSTDPAVSAEGRRRLDELVTSMQTSLEGSALADVAKAASNFQLLPIAYRHLLWLGQIGVDLEASSKRKVRVLLKGEELMQADLIATRDAIPPSAQLDLYVSVDDYFVGASIAKGNEPIATFIRGEVKPETRRQFRDLCGDRNNIEALEESLARTYAVMADTFKIPALHDKLLGLVQSLVDNIYRPGALLNVPLASRETVFKSMEKDGVLRIVNGDLKLLKSAAALSLAAALRLHPEEVLAEIPSFAGSVDEVLASLDRQSDLTDFPIVFGKNGYELASFV